MVLEATVSWAGSGKDGYGSIETQSKALHAVGFSFDSRFNRAEGTNPEELIAAAHAACFTMKLSFCLQEAGFVPEQIETTAQVLFERGEITASHLVLSACIGSISEEAFKICVAEALHCPVSNLLKAKITIETNLENPKT